MSRLFWFIELTGEQSKADEAPAEVRFYLFIFYLCSEIENANVFLWVECEFWLV